jgi:hypothetical protein
MIMRVSDSELLSRIESLARREHAATVEILLQLNEVERRRLHLTLGYGTMFDFATRHLRYSASAAGRRIQVARCTARHPELLGPLRCRELNLSTIALIAGVLDGGNVKELIDAARGKSQREVERIVATYRPAAEIRDRVRPVRAHRETGGSDADRNATPLFSEAPASSSNGEEPRGQSDTRSQVSHSLCGSGTPADAAEETVDSTRSRPEEDGPSEPRLSEPQFKVQFAAGPAFVRKLEEARAILSRRSPGIRLEGLRETALDAFLDRRPMRVRRRERGPLRIAAQPARRPHRAVRAGWLGNAGEPPPALCTARSPGSGTRVRLGMDATVPQWRRNVAAALRGPRRAASVKCGRVHDARRHTAIRRRGRSTRNVRLSRTPENRYGREPRR